MDGSRCQQGGLQKRHHHTVDSPTIEPTDGSSRRNDHTCSGRRDFRYLLMHRHHGHQDGRLATGRDLCGPLPEFIHVDSSLETGSASARHEPDPTDMGSSCTTGWVMLGQKAGSARTRDQRDERNTINRIGSALHGTDPCRPRRWRARP